MIEKNHDQSWDQTCTWATTLPKCTWVMLQAWTFNFTLSWHCINLIFWSIFWKPLQSYPVLHLGVPLYDMISCFAFWCFPSCHIQHPVLWADISVAVASCLVFSCRTCIVISYLHSFVVVKSFLYDICIYKHTLYSL